jgi:hypothetical protein
MLAITVPSLVMPETATLKTVPAPVTTAVVAPAVPLRVTSVPVKPMTASVNTTVKLMGEAPVGSTWVVAWLMVTIGLVVLKRTELSVLVEAALPLPPASVALPAAMLAMTSPSPVMPETATL